MPRAEREDPAATASVRRDGDALVFAGALERAAVAALWPRALALLPGATCLDLGAVAQVDSAGLALLAELRARAGVTVVSGDPPGLADLRGAYRLDATLAAAR